MRGYSELRARCAELFFSAIEKGGRMQKRKLASVQYVHDITPIEGADMIETAHVLGWQCVVKKGEFKVGDLGVYFEIDSFLPIRPEFEFLRGSSYKKTDLMGEGFRLKTKRMRGQLSQGLLLPLSILPPEGGWKVGDDVTDVLGVRKFEIEERVSTSGTIKGNIPYDIPKTDELRIQSFPELLDEIKEKPYYITTKMDGMSVTMYYVDGEFGVCSRNWEYKDDDKSAAWKFAHERELPERFADYADREGINRFVLQGEFCAPGIQKNPLKLTKPEWYVFNKLVWDEDELKWKPVGLGDLIETTTDLDVEMVPLEEFRGRCKYNKIDELLARAEGKYPSGKHKEGIVIRPVKPLRSYITGGRLSFKAINNDYLLKGGN